MKELLAANIELLRQAADLVDVLQDSFYVRQEPMFYHSTVGGHIRHCLEHYESFTEGVSEGKIDYDGRKRDPSVENQTLAARHRIDSIIQALSSLAKTKPKPALLVKMDCGCEESADNPLWQTSSIGRELQFLCSHTIHHFAMIRGICEKSGETLDPCFGVAPSTLRHRDELNRHHLQELA